MSERKDLIQNIDVIEASDVLNVASNMKTSGFRLGMISATGMEDGLEVMYTFERDEVLNNYKVSIPDDYPKLESVSPIYWAAFIYENELHDLFGIKFNNLALDYGGHFFKISEKTPWNPNAVHEKGGEE